jgi:hypothetical protein
MKSYLLFLALPPLHTVPTHPIQPNASSFFMCYIYTIKKKGSGNHITSMGLGNFITKDDIYRLNSHKVIQ